MRSKIMPSFIYVVTSNVVSVLSQIKFLYLPLMHDGKRRLRRVENRHFIVGQGRTFKLLGKKRKLT